MCIGARGATSNVELGRQGMTVGILGALELQQILAARLAGCQPDSAATTAALAGLGTVGLGLSLCLLSVTSGNMPCSPSSAKLMSRSALKRGVWQSMSWRTLVSVCVERSMLLLAVLQSGHVLLIAGMGTIGCAWSVQEFQPKLAKVQDFPWSVATADDAVRRTLFLSFELCWDGHGGAACFGSVHNGARCLKRFLVLLSPCRSASAMYAAP